MKKTNRYFALLGTILIVISALSFPAFASTLNTIEYTNSEGVIFRTVNVPNSKSRSSDFAIDDVLTALGFSSNVVANMPLDEKAKYAEGSSFTSSTTFIVRDENGNDTIITESQAEQLANNPIIPLGSANKNYDVLKITSVASQVTTNHSRYIVSTLVEWKTDPFTRYKDAIGAYVTESSIIDGESSSYLQYTRTINGTSNVQLERKNSSSADYKMDMAGAATFIYNLPNDASDGIGGEIKFEDFILYMSTRSAISHPNATVNFNVAGVYGHSNVAISGTPTLGLSGGSLTFSPTISISTYSIRFNETYKG